MLERDFKMPVKATALMAKWEETSFIEAVAREAKARAIKALEITTGSPMGKYANGGEPYQHVQDGNA